MRNLVEVCAALQALLPELRARWPIVALGVFGSYVRGEQRVDSDLDLLVDLDHPIDFFSLLDLEEEIGRRLGLRIELVTRPALKFPIRERILRELVVV